MEYTAQGICAAECRSREKESAPPDEPEASTAESWATNAGEGMPDMTPHDIIVDLRLANSANGKTRAYADATILFGSDGMMKISGYSVIHSDGEPPRVAPPARKGKSRYFDVISLTGRIRLLVESAILAEYSRQTKEAEA